MDSQGSIKGTSSVAFRVLIINCWRFFINLFFFNCLTLNIYLFIFNLFDAIFLFSENHVFGKQKRMAVYGRTSLVSEFKLARKNGDLLSLRQINFSGTAPCARGFPTKGIKLKLSVLFDVLRVPEHWGNSN